MMDDRTGRFIAALPRSQAFCRWMPGQVYLPNADYLLRAMNNCSRSGSRSMRSMKVMTAEDVAGYPEGGTCRIIRDVFHT